MKRAKIEICCGNINDIVNIQGLDYDRIELNSALELGGLTPSINTLKEAKKLTDKPIMCMVRTKTGDFTYTQAEKEVMYEDARLLLENGADGIVFGFLDDQKRIDIEALKIMREITRGKELVFHKAFDLIEDKIEALKILIENDVDRVLLMNESGEELFDAAKRIGEYMDMFEGKIQLLPGGGVNEGNILKILSLAKTGQVHGTFKETLSHDGLEHIEVSRQRVKDVIEILSKED